MATKAASTPTATGEQNKKAPALYDVGELRSKRKVGRAVFAGVCSAQGWKPGKAVTEEEFLEAVKKFENAPMRGSSGKKEVKK